MRSAAGLAATIALRVLVHDALRHGFKERAESFFALACSRRLSHHMDPSSRVRGWLRKPGCSAKVRNRHS